MPGRLVMLAKIDGSALGPNRAAAWTEPGGFRSWIVGPTHPVPQIRGTVSE